MDSLLVTGSNALSAANTFRGIGIDTGVNIHGTYFAALSAAFTGIPVGFQPDKADFIKESVKCSKRAQYFTEESGYHQTACYGEKGYDDFEGHDFSCHFSEILVGQEQGDASFYRSCRTYIFAEIRVAHACGICYQNRQHQHDDQQHAVFYILKPAWQLPFAFGKRDFVDEFLQESKGAEEAAYCSSKKNTKGA